MMNNHSNELLQAKIEELEAMLQTCDKSKLALDAAGFDLWETNFVTNESVGSNVNMLHSMGYGDNELPENVDDIMTLMHPDDREATMSAIQAHFQGKTSRYRAEFRIKAKDGSWIWMGNYGQVKERNEEGQVTRFIGVTFNIDQRRIMEETLKAMAYTDDLTDLGNRRMLFHTGALEMERAKRYKHPFTLLITDIDGFKKINDQHGHIVGDNILKKYADEMKATFRHVDMKIRYGGDEFIVLMPETKIDSALESAKRFASVISKMTCDGVESMTTSIGIARMNGDESLEALIKRADAALYTAKELGCNQVIVSDIEQGAEST